MHKSYERLQAKTNCSFCNLNLLSLIICKSNNLTASYNCLSRKRIASEQKEGTMQGSHTHQMSHLAITKPDKALQGIFHDPALSESSRHTYAQRLTAMSAKLGQPITELAMQPMTVISWIKTQYPEVATQKNVVTAVLAALRRMPATKPQHRQALAIWLRASKELKAQQQARLKVNEPSARQQRGCVDFREVIKIHTSLAKG